MKIGEKVQQAINDQIQHELMAEYTYLGMAAYFEDTPYEGFAKWMHKQSQEEHEHAMKLFDYLCERGGKVKLQALDAPKCDYANPLEVFQASLDHEKKVTQQIHDMFELAIQEKDYATMNFLNWFLEEQVEEEDSTGRMVEKLELAGDNVNALMRLDSAASKRDD